MHEGVTEVTEKNTEEAEFESGFRFHALATVLWLPQKKRRPLGLG